MEHGGSKSHLTSWKIWRSKEGEWRFQQEFTDEQNFTTVPSTIAPLEPIAEGVQSEFDGDSDNICFFSRIRTVLQELRF